MIKQIIEKYWQKKRTPAEIEESITNQDFTGGYKFLPWLWHFRKFMLGAILLNVFIVSQAIRAYRIEGESEIIIVSIVFGLCIPVVIMFLLMREFHNKKQGKSQ